MLWIWGSMRFLSLLWPHVPFGPWHRMKLLEEMNSLAKEAVRVACPWRLFWPAAPRLESGTVRLRRGERVGVQTAHTEEATLWMLSPGHVCQRGRDLVRTEDAQVLVAALLCDCGNPLSFLGPARLMWPMELTATCPLLQGWF